ncbi:hypothetical protein [Novosphingobium malaysiense]|uniref:hypothetical protein n=1 Tax=Novosphingobium malaysiense TaxID=1348853 RepID=UPI000B2434B3|nr:hypothetical protein [Novosphingobium malaysiense]
MLLILAGVMFFVAGALGMGTGNSAFVAFFGVGAAFVAIGAAQSKKSIKGCNDAR